MDREKTGSLDPGSTLCPYPVQLLDAVAVAVCLGRKTCGPALCRRHPADDVPPKGVVIVLLVRTLLFHLKKLERRTAAPGLEVGHPAKVLGRKPHGHVRAAWDLDRHIAGGRTIGVQREPPVAGKPKQNQVFDPAWGDAGGVNRN